MVLSHLSQEAVACAWDFVERHYQIPKVESHKISDAGNEPLTNLLCMCRICIRQVCNQT